jgi:pimeloyl-ACP methyl ester carboxylesterase
MDVPTLVVTGSEDPTITPTRGDELAAAVSGARHVVVDGAAHLANVDRPDAFTAAVLDHLEAT